MFDIGFSEMLLLAIIALIAIGPKQLPEVARQAARFINELKRLTAELTGQMTDMKGAASKLFQDTQEQLNKSLEPTDQILKENTVLGYKVERVVPPEHSGPLPEPEPDPIVPDHPPYEAPEAGGEQLALTLESTDEKPNGKRSK